MSILTHMKTTVEIADELLDEVKRLAEKDQTTVRALIEEGLRQVVAIRARSGRFRLKKASYRGKGLHPEVQGGNWETIREFVYEGHGA